VARDWPLQPLVTLRKRLTQVFAAAAILVAALTSVGLTAPVDWPFSLRICPVLFRVDPAAVAEPRAYALGLDIDLKLGGMHLHLGWSAIPLLPASTKPEPNPF
jgi:hypothetical protein